MKTLAVRMYGENDLRLECFELPSISENEILARVVTDSICMSTYKAAIQGKRHKRVPENIDTHPVIIGHEFCGEIVEVGKKWKGKYKAGSKFIIQPALCYNGSLDAPGYSYEYIGGASQYIVIPNEVMETDNLIPFSSDCFFKGSLSEPMSCIIGAFNANYHTEKGKYIHKMGTKPGGKMLILAGCGPMGIGAIDYAINAADMPPELLVVTDLCEERLLKAKELFNHKSIVFLNSSEKDELMKLSGGLGYDDVFVFAPSTELVELGDSLLCEDGCLNFFAGPTDSDFSAKINFYKAHYLQTHIVGTSGGNREDMVAASMLMEKNIINPSTMITHIGGLDAIIETTLDLPKISGGKKLIYTGISLPLSRIDDFEKLSCTNIEHSHLYKELDRICKKHGGIWNAEAEKYLLNNGKKMEA